MYILKLYSLHHQSGTIYTPFIKQNPTQLVSGRSDNQPPLLLFYL